MSTAEVMAMIRQKIDEAERDATNGFRKTHLILVGMQELEGAGICSANISTYGDPRMVAQMLLSCMKDLMKDPTMAMAIMGELASIVDEMGGDE